LAGWMGIFFLVNKKGSQIHHLFYALDAFQ